MQRLWAPWRMAYIKNVDKEDEGCIFCTKPLRNNDRDDLILFRGKKCFVLMNLYPYSNGHLMVTPYQHTSDILSLDRETTMELWDFVCLCKKVLTEACNPEGFNVGMNLGRVSGAGIDQHIHMHIVPRWNGDTNFMPVLGDTKVISEGIEQTYDTLKPLFKSIGETFLG
ncbi:HIT domain-containing protein [Chitinispirillales bacterium ANBcel5]|uniref:HIT family protein n=1 Tax=Cellulosispirillum alkaliphilum TaxID=3039283 RepID=UPI002A57E866|nr:HIT domain-containing protein [Chitinispirillales bacterium ANBcel5]